MISRRGFLSGLGVLIAASTASLIGCAAAPAGTGPREVLLIRHAEEPEAGTSVNLNDTGRQRAAALVALFPSRFPPPTFLFAARPSKHTSRPVETLEPLAKALNLPIDQRFDEKQFDMLAQMLLTQPLYSDSHVVICWQHSTMPELAAALGVANPPRWSNKRYDRIWRIERNAGHATLQDLPQGLLPGDSR